VATSLRNSLACVAAARSEYFVIHFSYEHGAAVGRDTASLVERSVAVNRPPAEVGDELVGLGATLLTVGVSGPDYDLSLVEQWVAWRDARAEG